MATIDLLAENLSLTEDESWESESESEEESVWSSEAARELEEEVAAEVEELAEEAADAEARETMPPTNFLKPAAPPSKASPTANTGTNNVVTSHLSPSEIVSLLVSWGCPDLTTHLDISRCSEYPVGSGGFGDVYSGTLTYGAKVAIKTMRPISADGYPSGKYQKRAAKELHTWSKCRHPNVVLLWGFAEFRGRLAMIAPWAAHGNMTLYLANNPSADRCILSVHVCKGLVYLHSNDIVHGDLKGVNILVSDRGIPMLADFGNASLVESAVFFTTTASAASFSIRWTAPEIVRGSTSVTRAADIYALGMTILEIFTGQPPFVGVADLQVLSAVVHKKKIPKRPEAQIPSRSISGNILWALLRGCWAQEPPLRPTASYVESIMSMIKSETLVYIEPLPLSDPESEAEDMDEL